MALSIRQATKSIPRHGVVYLGVGVEAAFEIGDVGEAGPLQGLGHVSAADAVVADHYGLLGGVELRESPLELGHRDELGALDAGELELPSLPHVEQYWQVARVEPRLELAWRYVLVLWLPQGLELVVGDDAAARDVVQLLDYREVRRVLHVFLQARGVLEAGEEGVRVLA